MILSSSLPAAHSMMVIEYYCTVVCHSGLNFTVTSKLLVYLYSSYIEELYVTGCCLHLRFADHASVALI